MLQVKNNTALLAMPAEVRVFTLQNCVSASPYNRCDSGSFYNTTEKTWDYTPEGAIRVSDHWNFYSRGTQHCITDVSDDKIIGHWVVAQYNNGIWNVICMDKKDTSAFDLHYKRIYAAREEMQVSDLRTKRIQKLAQIRETRRREERARKMKARTLWVTFEIKTWSGSGRRVRFAGWETITGQLVYESGCKMIVEVNGRQTEYRACSNYKELKRKPYTFTKKATV